MWSLQNKSDQLGDWTIYLDGALWANFPAVYPADVLLDRNYIGRSNGTDSGQYVGYMDSFFLFTDVIGPIEARGLFEVSLCVCANVCVYVCLYMCI